MKTSDRESNSRKRFSLFCLSVCPSVCPSSGYVSDSYVTLDKDVRQRIKFQVSWSSFNSRLLAAVLQKNEGWLSMVNAASERSPGKFTPKQEEIDKLSKLHEEVQKKNDECESLKQHLTKAMYQGKSFALMPSIDADHEVASPFLTPKPKAKAKRKTMGTDESFMSEDEYFVAVSDEEDDVDEDKEVYSDEEWETVLTHKLTTKGRFKPKKDPSRNSITKCNCKGNCLKKICGCRKQGIVCSDHCKCSSQCRNIEQPGSTTNPDDDSISTTLNSTYNLEEKENISSQNSSANEFVEPMIPKRKSRTNNTSEIISSTEGATKREDYSLGVTAFLNLYSCKFINNVS
ncbi:KIF4 [Mytilus edulis]|uniref:KIF4 n=1 Tax=Mytilus edulis TaxID=6550 RepID=A0A8S3UXG2_MYTED|nr:KIF4 [Mytilus edulis]